MESQKRTILSRLRIDRAETILLLVWLSINLFILVHRGIYLQGESAKYIHQAHLLLETGRVETPNFWLYFTEIALIACCIKFNLSFYFAIVLQLLLNLTAMLAFYRTTSSLFQNKNTALAGTLLLILNYPYQEFNSFLYTESLFYSLTLLLSCYIIRIEALTFKKLLVVTLLLALVCFTRPTGLLFLPPAFLYIFVVFFKKMSIQKKTALLAALCLGFLFLLNKALGSGGELDFLLPFRDETIICGMPTIPGLPPIPASADNNSLYGLGYYILQNPAQCIHLAALRTLAFFGVYRSYYSAGHNLYLIVYYYSIYLAVLLSVSYWIRRQPSAGCYFAISIILAWVTVMLTCDDWHNRFYLTISPFLIILGLPILSRITSSGTSYHTHC
jgi:hypothetical protein